MQHWTGGETPGLQWYPEAPVGSPLHGCWHWRWCLEALKVAGCGTLPLLVAPIRLVLLHLVRFGLLLHHAGLVLQRCWMLPGVLGSTDVQCEEHLSLVGLEPLILGTVQALLVGFEPELPLR